MTAFTRVCVPGMNWEQPAWLSLTESSLQLRPRKVLLLTPRRSNSFWLLLFPSASALQFCLSPSLAHILWLLLYLQVCSYLSFLPATLPATPSGLLLNHEQRNSMKRKIQDKNLANLAGKDNLACKQTFQGDGITLTSTTKLINKDYATCNIKALILHHEH